jgi:hypothetical protein
MTALSSLLAFTMAAELFTRAMLTFASFYTINSYIYVLLSVTKGRGVHLGYIRVSELTTYISVLFWFSMYLALDEKGMTKLNKIVYSFFY